MSASTHSRRQIASDCARWSAVLLLTQVLSWSAAETAASLDMTVAAVNSALQRARATLDARNPAVVPRTLSVEQHRLVARYVEAFEQYDVSALTALLHEEATFSMPPYDLWLQGHESIAQWLLGFGIGCKGSRLVPVAACGGTPAFAHYRDNGAQPWALLALELSGKPDHEHDVVPRRRNALPQIRTPDVADRVTLCAATGYRPLADFCLWDR